MKPDRTHPQWEYMVVYVYVEKGVAYAEEYELPGSGEILRPVPLPLRQQLAAFLNDKGLEGWDVIALSEGSDINLWRRILPWANRTMVLVAKRAKDVAA